MTAMEKHQCLTCGEMHTPDIDAIWLDVPHNYCQCAWCHLAEWGVWPHGLAMDDEVDIEKE